MGEYENKAPLIAIVCHLDSVIDIFHHIHDWFDPPDWINSEILTWKSILIKFWNDIKTFCGDGHKAIVTVQIKTRDSTHKFEMNFSLPHHSGYPINTI